MLVSRKQNLEPNILKHAQQSMFHSKHEQQRTLMSLSLLMEAVFVRASLPRPIQDENEHACNGEREHIQFAIF